MHEATSEQSNPSLRFEIGYYDRRSARSLHLKSANVSPVPQLQSQNLLLRCIEHHHPPGFPTASAFGYPACATGRDVAKVSLRHLDILAN